MRDAERTTISSSGALVAVEEDERTVTAEELGSGEVPVSCLRKAIGQGGAAGDVVVFGEGQSVVAGIEDGLDDGIKAKARGRVGGANTASAGSGTAGGVLQEEISGAIVECENRLESHACCKRRCLNEDETARGDGEGAEDDIVVGRKITAEGQGGCRKRS